MLTVTSIGVIDTSREDNLQFAFLSMDYSVRDKVSFVYDLYKDGCLELAVLMQHDVDALVTEIMHLKHLHNRAKHTCYIGEVACSVSQN